MTENLPEGWTLPNLRIDRDGDWYGGDVQVTHPGILANLRGTLRKDGQGYCLQTRVRIPVVVEDAPWVVTRVEPRAERLHVVLNDGSEADVDATTVRLGRGDAPYCRIEGDVDARFNRAAAFQLLALAEYAEATRRRTCRLGHRPLPLCRTARIPRLVRHRQGRPGSRAAVPEPRGDLKRVPRHHGGRDAENENQQAVVSSRACTLPPR